MNAYRNGYIAGYIYDDLADYPTYKGEELHQYWRGFEQGQIDYSIGLPLNEKNGEKSERQPNKPADSPRVG